MKKIKIDFEYDYTGDDNEILDVNSYYETGKTDHIVITNRRIVIEGKRGNHNKPDEVLNNTNSTMYSQLLKAIVYLFFVTGKQFNIGEVTVKVNEEIKQYLSGEIVNPCGKPLDMDLKIICDECKIIFANCYMKDRLLIAYVWLIKGIQQDDFDYLWKSFNSLYSMISSVKEENKKLRDMRIYMENNWSRFSRLNEFLENETKNSIRKLRIREFVLSIFEDENHTKAYAEMVKSFDDYRLAELFKEIMPYREEKLKLKGLYNEVLSHINLMIAKREKRNFDLARFYILKYTYFLRNKYFHAEKTSPVFVLTNNNENMELVTIKRIMQLFLVDLLESTSLFIR